MTSRWRRCRKATTPTPWLLPPSIAKLSERELTAELLVELGRADTPALAKLFGAWALPPATAELERCPRSRQGRRGENRRGCVDAFAGVGRRQHRYRARSRILAMPDRW
jgi:hypothetical protein